MAEPANPTCPVELDVPAANHPRTGVAVGIVTLHTAADVPHPASRRELPTHDRGTYPANAPHPASRRESISASATFSPKSLRMFFTRPVVASRPRAALSAANVPQPGQPSRAAIAVATSPPVISANVPHPASRRESTDRHLTKRKVRLRTFLTRPARREMSRGTVKLRTFLTGQPSRVPWSFIPGHSASHLRNVPPPASRREEGLSGIVSQPLDAANVPHPASRREVGSGPAAGSGDVAANVPHWVCESPDLMTAGRVVKVLPPAARPRLWQWISSALACAVRAP